MQPNEALDILYKHHKIGMFGAEKAYEIAIVIEELLNKIRDMEVGQDA